MTSYKRGYLKLMELTYPGDFEQQIRCSTITFVKIGEYIFDHRLLECPHLAIVHIFFQEQIIPLK